MLNWKHAQRSKQVPVAVAPPEVFHVELFLLWAKVFGPVLNETFPLLFRSEESRNGTDFSFLTAVAFIQVSYQHFLTSNALLYYFRMLEELLQNWRGGWAPAAGPQTFRVANPMKDCIQAPCGETSPCGSPLETRRRTTAQPAA